MSDTITIKLVKTGERLIEVDRHEYEGAKANGDLGQLLDHEISDMETRTVIIEENGHEEYPWG